MRGNARAGTARLGLALCVVVGMLVLPAPASATKTFSFSFGSQGTLGGQFASPSVGNKQIAVNQTGAGGVAPGTLYVTDPANVRVESFDANGNFLRAWGRDVVQSGKAEDTGTGFEICEVAANCQAGLRGEGAGQLWTESGARPMGGIAVDQSNGHVYVFDAGNFRVEEFDPTGHFIRAWGDDVTSAGSGNTGANEQQKLTVKATKGAFSLSPITAESRGIETPGSNVITGIEPTLGSFRVGDSIRGRGITKSTHTTITAVGADTLTVSHNIVEAESGSFLYVAEENTGATGEGNLTAGSTAVTGLASYSGAFAVGETISGEGIPATTTIASCSPSCGTAATALTLSKAVEAGKTATGVELTGNDIPFAATHEELQAHLDALPGIGPSGVTASGGPGSSTGSTPYTVAFSGGALAGNDVAAMESSIAGLGGAGKGATVETTVPGGGPEICNPGAGDTCKAGVEASGGGEFARTGKFQYGYAGAGVDSAGNVYIGDAGNARVQKFDSTGHFLAAGGWDVDAANPSTEYEVCTVAVNCKAGIAGNGAGQFTKELLLAVAPSGDVYASNEPANKVFHLSASLAFDPSFAPAAALGSELSLATGTGDGHLFVASASDGGLFYEIEPGTGALLQADPAKNASLFGAMAVNSATGRLYAGDGEAVDVYTEGSTVPVPAILPATAVGPGKATLNGHAYPNGTALTECAFEYLPEAEYIAHSQSFAGATVKPCAESTGEIGAVIGPVSVHYAATGLAPNTKYVYRLALANINGRRESSEQFFTTLANLTLSATTTAPSAIGAHKATLNGTVNPQGQALTECVFEWGRTAAYEEAPVPCTAPSAAEVLPDSNPHAVHATIAGLALGSEYHYRLRVVSSEASAHGADEPILTLGPTLGASWSEGVTLREATLKAEIDPQGSATTYRFEYGTAPYAEGEAPHGASVPIPPGAVGADGALHTVAASIEGLHPATTYHYRVIAESECEAAQHCLKEGPDRELTTYAEPPSSDGCPNAPFRVGPGAALPDCRAYEMVSPVDKGGGDIVAAQRPGAGSTAFTQAAIEGGRITYTSSTNFGDAQRGAYAAQYLATRGAGGWSTEAIDAPQGTTVFDPAFEDAVDLQNAFQAFTPDLCHALMVDQNLIPLTEDAIHGYTDIYWRDNCGPGAGSLEAVTTGEPPSSSGYGPSLNTQARNYSADRCETILAANSALTPDAAPGDQNNAQIYDFSCDGARHLVSVLPNGQASAIYSRVGTGSGAGAHDTTSAGAVSSDASRVFWTASGNGPGALYLRLNPGAEETGAKDDAGNCVPDPTLACTIAIAFGAQFWAADSEGETAIYSAGGSLYEYAVVTEEATKIAGQVGGVVGASSDLSRLYFTAEEAIPGSGQNEQGEEARAGRPNLYLREGGEDSFVATLAAQDKGQVDSPSPNLRLARTSADGAHLAFTSKSAALAHSVAHYDNTDQATGEADNEVYLYDAETGKLACASCNPTGARPAGGNLGPTPTAAYIPGWQWSNNASRVLSSDGSRLFFNSFDSLAPADTNGRLDVYEWEAPGTGPVGGRCAESSPSFSARDGGCLNLISTGRSQSPSSFVDASADGRDAFISTDSSIDPRDPGLIDIYDAREGGGFPPPPPEAPECAGDACQSVPAAPEDPTPASAAFQGPGNVTEEAPSPAPCAKGKVKRQGRCVAQKHRKRAHKRHRTRHADRGRSAR